MIENSIILYSKPVLTINEAAALAVV